eukprot:TRINITY_DN7273_c0_g1_i2.p1 TRINITY_DN7273_c0_g1~~TRINITY_DN7273_c0_g1_i2.p1  ORF type:complete len:531 (+),score=96.70 TRINITY_DN7273_c0_g1_i2:85-1677(+)
MRQGFGSAYGLRVGGRGSGGQGDPGGAQMPDEHLDAALDSLVDLGRVDPERRRSPGSARSSPARSDHYHGNVWPEFDPGAVYGPGNQAAAAAAAAPWRSPGMEWVPPGSRQATGAAAAAPHRPPGAAPAAAVGAQQSVPWGDIHRMQQLVADGVVPGLGPSVGGGSKAPTGVIEAGYPLQDRRYIPAMIEPELPSGYNYVSEEQDDVFVCPICFEWLIDPVMFSCPANHMLCRACLPSGGQCPVDRERVELKEVPGFVRSKLDGLAVRCPACDDWTGARGDLRQHLSGCPMMISVCSQCGVHVRSGDSHMHCKSCRWVGSIAEGHFHCHRWNCGYVCGSADGAALEAHVHCSRTTPSGVWDCEWVGPREALEEHERHCLSVTCQHAACDWKGTAAELDEHLHSDCGFEHITCDCGQRLPRCELPQHTHCGRCPWAGQRGLHAHCGAQYCGWVGTERERAAHEGTCPLLGDMRPLDELVGNLRTENAALREDNAQMARRVSALERTVQELLCRLPACPAADGDAGSSDGAG